VNEELKSLRRQVRFAGANVLPSNEGSAMSFTEIAPHANEDTCSATGNAPGMVRHATIPLRCFVYATGENCYRAECIDLDITAEGSTEEEAKAGLCDALLGYLSVLCAGQDMRGTDENDIREFILRPSPLTHRIRYCIGRILPKPGQRTNDRFYKLQAPCHC
jgi:hypothetical protein